MLNTVITQICSTTNILMKYNQYLDFMNNKAAIDLELESIEKYQKYIAQIADKLGYF